MVVRLSLQVKRQLVHLVDLEFSLAEIRVILGIPKSTIYYYYRLRRGRRYKIPFIGDRDSFEAGEVLGIFVGDGSLTFYHPSYEYAGYICFSVKNEGYALYVQKLYQNYFQKEFSLQQYDDMFRLRFYGKRIYSFFSDIASFENKYKSTTISLTSLNHSKSFFLGFLKGLVDTDGCVWFRNNRPRTEIATSSKKLAEQIIHIFLLFGIETTRRVNNDLSNKKSTVVFKPSRTPNNKIRIRFTIDSERFNELARPWKYVHGAAAI